jgi:hypothetical protein
MMNFNVSVLCIFTAFLTANAFPSESSGGNRQKRDSCPGGYSDGTQMDIGRYWYQCKNGQVVPKGCLSEDGRRVEIDDTFDTKQFRVKCVMGGDGYLTVTIKSCIHQGSNRDVGDQWDDGTAYYTCVKDGSNVRVAMLGCVNQGNPLKFDDRVAKSDFIYQCKKSTDGTPILNKVGCVFEGRKYNIGDSFDGSKSWYMCSENGAKVVGCLHESHRLETNDRITKSDMVYNCKVNDDSTEFVPYACIMRDGGSTIEKKPGCFWTEDSYEYTCRENGSKLSKVQTQCVYTADRGSFKVQPGCITVADTIAVGCLQDSSSGKLTLQTYSADNVDNVPGLRKC